MDGRLDTQSGYLKGVRFFEIIQKKYKSFTTYNKTNNLIEINLLLQCGAASQIKGALLFNVLKSLI